MTLSSISPEGYRRDSRVIMENIGGDEPFGGGDIPGPQVTGDDRPHHGLRRRASCSHATVAAIGATK